MGEGLEPGQTHRPQPARASVQSRDGWPPTVREALTLDLAEGTSCLFHPRIQCIQVPECYWGRLEKATLRDKGIYSLGH